MNDYYIDPKKYYVLEEDRVNYFTDKKIIKDADAGHSIVIPKKFNKDDIMELITIVNKVYSQGLIHGSRKKQVEIQKTLGIYNFMGVLGE